MRHCLEFGDPNGFPVVYCHGTPGSAAEGELADTAARRYRLRVIALDRPGYGDVPPAFEMGYSAWGKATARFLAENGIAHYGLLAVSGGAPNALALASVDSQHVAALSLVCGLGPLTEPELAQSAGGLVRWMLRQAERNLDTLDRLALRPLSAFVRTLPFAAVMLMQLYNSRPDRRTLSRPDTRRMLARSLQRACHQGSAGVKRDLRLMLKKWDFNPAEVSIPVKLWHGMDDRMLFPEHGRWLAHHLDCAELTLLEGEGHFSLPIGRVDMILKDLAGRFVS
jgi:pimeloyl-ACP methyl ester carboxylesterase